MPFKIMKVAQMHSKNFQTTLKEIEKSGKKAYELTIENMKKDVGRYHDEIKIITDRSNFMPLTIKVDGYIDAIGQKPGPGSTPPADAGIAPQQKMVIVPPSKPEPMRKPASEDMDF